MSRYASERRVSGKSIFTLSTLPRVKRHAISTLEGESLEIEARWMGLVTSLHRVRARTRRADGLRPFRLGLYTARARSTYIEYRAYSTIQALQMEDRYPRSIKEKIASSDGTRNHDHPLSRRRFYQLSYRTMKP